MKLYIVVRNDLSPGMQAAQSCHALRLFVQEYPATEAVWYEQSNNLVVLQVPNEHVLHRLAKHLQDCGVGISMFREPDLGNEVTAIAVEPVGEPHLSTLALALKRAA